MHLVQKNAEQLKELAKSYRRLQSQVDMQNKQLEEIFKLLNASAESSTMVVINKGKSKDKAKSEVEFYQVSIQILIYYWYLINDNKLICIIVFSRNSQM